MPVIVNSFKKSNGLIYRKVQVGYGSKNNSLIPLHAKQDFFSKKGAPSLFSV